jgi:FKBP-type peptidyl-prolyl cis-trans isomerase
MKYRIMGSKRFLVILIPFLLIIVACDRIVEDPLGDELARFKAWMRVNKIDTTTITPNGLYYLNKQTGLGASPTDSSYLVYSFTKSDIDYNVSETTYKDVAELWGIFSYTTHYVPNFALFTKESTKSNGLSDGLNLTKVGGKARLIIPPGTYGIKSYGASIYDIELIKVVLDPKVYEKDTLQKYLTLNPGFISIGDSIYYKKITNGTDSHYIGKDTVVEVRYTGKFLDGIVFDTNIDTIAKARKIYDSSKSYADPLKFKVGSIDLIPGFSIAVKKMIKGDRAVFIIPSEFGYGASGKSSGTVIHPYTTLIFEIYLEDYVITQKPKPNS